MYPKEGAQRTAEHVRSGVGQPMSRGHMIGDLGASRDEKLRNAHRRVLEAKSTRSEEASDRREQSRSEGLQKRTEQKQNPVQKSTKTRRQVLFV